MGAISTIENKVTATEKAAKRGIYSDLVQDYLADVYSDHMLIYVGTWGKYNNGDLSGAWLDLELFTDYDEFVEVCRELHYDEPDPEFMVQDIQSWPYNEDRWDYFWPNKDFFRGLQEYLRASEDERGAIPSYLCHFGINFEDFDYEEFSDKYRGEFDSPADFMGQDLNENCEDYYNLPNHIKDYIDFEKMANGWEAQNDYTFVRNSPTSTYVFYNF